MWSYIVDFFFNILQQLGLLNKSGKLLVLGLDNAGKSTLLGVLVNNRVSQFQPTQRATSENVKIGNVDFIAFDMGGHQEVRHVWKEYITGIDALVFVVDAHDKERRHEAKEELHKLLKEEEMINVPILILGNKIDLRQCMSEEELANALNISLLRTGKNNNQLETPRQLELFMCSVIHKSGYPEGFQWLAKQF